MKGLVLWHPESPGVRVPVVRSWWQRLFYPRKFATISEVLRHYAYQDALKAMKGAK